MAVVAAVVLIGANDSTKSTPARPAPRAHVIYTLRWGDEVRDPRTGTICDASGEAGLPNLSCRHTRRGRHEAVFWSDELQVYGPGSEAMSPTYSFKWWGRLRPGSNTIRAFPDAVSAGVCDAPGEEGGDTMTTISHEPSTRSQRLSWLYMRDVWASLAISVMWLAVMVTSLWGPNIE